MSTIKLLAGIPLAIGLLAATSPAWGGGADEATGAALFQEAKALAAAGDYEHACPKFVEAQRLFPTTGTLLNIGDCYEKLGKLASAWGSFRQAEVAARNAGDQGRQGEAARRAESLSLRLAKLAINVPPAVRVPGFELKRDGVVIGEGQWGSPLPVDVGQHTIEATAPGHKAWSMWVRIDTNGSTATIEVVPLEPVPPSSAAAPESERWSAQRVAGVAVGSVGAAGVVIGAVLGGLAISKNNASKADCRPDAPSICMPMGMDLRLQAGRLADASTATFIAGGVALVGGVVLFVTAPRKGPPKTGGLVRIEAHPVVADRFTGLSVAGWW